MENNVSFKICSSKIYKLRDWINISRLDSHSLFQNLNVINLLNNNLDKILKLSNYDLYILSYNYNAIHILEKNINIINWFLLSTNKNALYLLENPSPKLVP